MMKTQYLIRLDDACPTMDSRKWQRMEDILDHYGIQPLVGIIPANADPEIMIDPEDVGFWEKVHRWQEKGWAFALHGYDHVYVTKSGGLNPVHHHSEFAGLTYEQQCEKIEKGLMVLKKHSIEPDYFFAPSHTFDENTLKALQNKTNIRKISDMIALRPYTIKNGMLVVPCQLGRFRHMPIPGYWSACYHPNEMNDNHFEALESFLKRHSEDFVSYQELSAHAWTSKSWYDRILGFCYYLMRQIKG